MRRRHPLLSQKTFKLSRIRQIELSSPLRTDVAQTFLECKFNAIFKHAAILSSLPENEFDDNTYFEAVSNIKIDYEFSTQTKFQTKYKEFAEEIYRVFYIKHFEPLHENNIEFINNFIHNQSHSLYSIEFKLDTLLTLFETAFDLAMFDVERSFRNINGQFTDIENRMKAARPKRAFISYAHRDELYKNEMMKHLQPLVKTGKLTVWDDRQIKPGANWRKNIENAINEADIFIALISSDFIASPYCYTVELNMAVQRNMTIIYIIARTFSMEYYLK